MTQTSSHLHALRRRADLTAAADEVTDVLVIGGGISGVGIALDAASRGLSVTLLEANDLAFGTSRWSSKLVHGGLRYLANGDVATAKESALERHLLMTVIAPHLIRPLGQLLPFRPGVSHTQRAAGALGMSIGDALRLKARTPRSVLPAPRLVSASTARRLTPALDPDGLRGGMLSFDGQLEDDARLVVTVARTAARLGARILTRVQARTLTATGAAATDTLTGETFDLRARCVINATGVWAGSLDEQITVRPSRGTHLVLDAADLGHPTAALTVPHPGSISRYVFALPQQHGRVIVGLTDEDAPGAVPDVPQPTETEITFLLDTLNSVLATPVRRDQVRGAFAGLRPLVDAGDRSTSDISRRHLVATSDAGFVSVLGGKLTTYRRMAQDAVDHALATQGVTAGPSRTAAMRLVDDAPSASAGTPLVEGLSVTAEQVAFAVAAEGALDVADVLDRRTRIGLVDADRMRAYDVIAPLVADALDALGSAPR